MNSVFLTGASGFIGSRLSSVIPDRYYLRQAFRESPRDKPLSNYVICDFDDSSILSSVLEGIDVVVHCAGRAHLVRDNSTSPVNEFRRVNVDLTLRLALEAVNSGVKRFIFMSSIGVNGDNNTSPYTEQDTSSPVEDYAISKLEAEQGLQKIALASGMEVVIIRPPLVYGPSAPGNFGKLMNWMHKNIPLPLGAIHNKRSFIALDNLISFIIHCIDHPKAANEVFLISDGEDVSTTELLRRVSRALGKKPRLLPVPVGLMAFAAKLLGKESVANRLFGSLQVDSSKARDLLGWRPVVTMEEQLKTTAEAWLKRRRQDS